MTISDTIKNEIEEFFRDKAFAYSSNQLRYVSLLYVVPCQFKFGTKLMQFETSLEVAFALGQYRENLLAGGYKRTTAEVGHIDIGDSGAICCLLTYRNLDAADQVLNEEYVCYFLKRSHEGLLQITSTEYVDDPIPHLFAGMDELILTAD